MAEPRETHELSELERDVLLAESGELSAARRRDVLRRLEKDGQARELAEMVALLRQWGRPSEERTAWRLARRAAAVAAVLVIAIGAWLAFRGDDVAPVAPSTEEASRPTLDLDARSLDLDARSLDLDARSLDLDARSLDLLVRASSFSAPSAPLLVTEPAAPESTESGDGAPLPAWSSLQSDSASATWRDR